MRTQIYKIACLIIAGFILITSTFASAQAQNNMSIAANEEPENYIQFKVIPEKTHIEAGETVLVAVEKDIYEKWHTYWKNPGDSGAAGVLNWELPDGFEVGEIMWPAPKRIPYEPLLNFGYEGETVLLQELTAPTTLPEGPINFKINYEFLVCHEICIPEIGTLELTLNDGEQAVSNEDYINEKHMNLPIPINWYAEYKEENKQLIINVEVNNAALIAQTGEKVRFDFFPEEWGYIENTDIVDIKITGMKKLEIRVNRGDRELQVDQNLDFVLTYKKDKEKLGALLISAEPNAAWLQSYNKTAQVTQETAPAESADQAQNSNIPSITVAQAILYALLGGLVLNLMPCVFPILSMKALHFSEAIHEQEGANTKIHGLAYTAGILLCFGALAITLITLQAAGSQIGWGFQLQNPIIILGLVFLFFLVGLSLSGFFELQTNLSNAGSSLTSRKGPSGSFFTGILATIVATPCTAPFMGVAIGFALTQPTYVSITIFLALGLGLALPFLVLSFVPSLHKVFPKPGAWMVTFKEFLAFPIYLSVIWLIWVFIQQTGSLGVIYALGGIVGIAFGVWLLSKRVNKYIVIAVIALSMIIPFTCGCLMPSESERPAQEISSVAQPFSISLYEELVENTDEPIFINMTAAWCITCKVNERVALSSDNFFAILKDNNISYIKGDWTNYDPEITEFLDKYGRSGVPIYVYYGPRDKDTGKRPEAKVMPQILTPGLVRKTLSAR